MGIFLVIVGLLLWLLAGWSLVGIILIIIGLVLIFVPGAPYGYSSWRGRGAPPP